VTFKGSGEEIPTSPAERVVDSFSRRVATMATTDHRHHRILSGTNSSSSNVLSSRQRLIVYAARLDVLSAVTGVVTRRFIGAMVLYGLITVVHHLLGIMNASVEPPLA